MSIIHNLKFFRLIFLGLNSEMLFIIIIIIIMNLYLG